MNEPIEELLAVYVLGGLSPEEEAEIEAYVAENSQAAALLAQAYAAAAPLPYAARPLQPSPEAEAALFTRIQADLAAQATRATIPASIPARTQASPPGFWQSLRALFETPLVTAVGVGTAVLVLLWSLSLSSQVQELNRDLQQLSAENNSLQTEIDLQVRQNVDLTTRVAELQAANQTLDQQNVNLTQTNADLIAANHSLQTGVEEASVNLEELEAYSSALEAELATTLASQPFSSGETFAVTLPGTEGQPGASAQLVMDLASNTALLIVDGLPTLPENSVYQVLLIRGTEHETAETFRVDTQGEGVLLVHSNEPLQSFDAVGVSIEPEGGSAQRTGDIVLLGSLAN